MCVQRNLKALGTFGYMATVRGNTVYLPYIPRTLAHVRRNLARHPELAGLRRALAPPHRGARLKALSDKVTDAVVRIGEFRRTTWARKCSSRAGSTTSDRAASSSS